MAVYKKTSSVAKALSGNTSYRHILSTYPINTYPAFLNIYLTNNGSHLLMMKVLLLLLLLLLAATATSDTITTTVAAITTSVAATTLQAPRPFLPPANAPKKKSKNVYCTMY